MSTRVGFHLDVSACSGCKACQLACRDRHALPPGVQWRRIYEVSGGGWRQQGSAWMHDVFAYYLSIACNHCERPICVEVCPTGAMRQRADGIVLVDGGRCVGCGYCAWACPYDAPQLDSASRTMTKCTFCVEELDAGREPVCVAACPLRSLTSPGLTTPDARRDAVAAVPPLPDPELTRPALRLRPHAHTAAAQHAAGTRVANREELPPRAARGEPSLVAFTLLAQGAAGLVWTTTMQRLLTDAGAAAAERAQLTLALALLAAGVAASLFHLGHPLRAWRALGNVRRSWLSRELLLTALFGLVTAAAALLPVTGRAVPLPLLALAAAAGAAMVLAMARVYRLRTLPAWNRASTTVAFFGSAVVLGVPAALLATASATRSTPPAIIVAALVVLLAAVPLAVRARLRFYRGQTVAL